MASSTVGASTFIVWKRRSSAASFSIYLRYSFIVVAPTHCNSPRLNAGLMIFDAYRAFGRTSPDDRVQLVDEEDHIFGTAYLVHHRFDALFELAPVFCSGNH